MTNKTPSAIDLVPQAARTPLVELLQRIPPDTILRWQQPDGLQAHCSAPVGRLAHEAADTITRLRAALDWQPIETAPREEGEVLVWNDQGLWLASRLGTSDEWWSDNGRLVRDPTHWMPLPEPPSGRGGSRQA